jgi:glycosyltransferase involved in cell wall biosynthesis
VTTEWSPETAGGIGRAVRSLAESCAEGAIVLLDQPSRLVRAAQRGAPDGVSIFGVRELASPGLPSHVFASEAHFRSDRIHRALATLLAREAIDRIEFPDYDGLGFVTLKAARLGVGPALPRIDVRLHGTLERIARGDRRELLSLADKQRAAMERYGLRHAAVIIAPSQDVLDEYRCQYALGGEALIDPPLVSRPAVRPMPPAGSGPLRLGFLGKIQPIKGPELLVRAAVALLEAAQAPILEIDLVGSDAPGRFEASHRREIEGLIPKRHSDRFHFHGPLPRHEAHRRMAGCHAVVLPSRSETFGLAARELASIGMPLALSDVAAFRSGFDEARGPIERFAVDDADALGAILARWVDSLAQGAWPPAESGSAPVRPDMPSVDLPMELEVGRVARVPLDERPLVSIVLPFHEMQDFVDECLTSIARDPYPRKEIVIVDDGSPSQPSQVKLQSLARSFQGDPDRHVVRKANGGLGSARNAGVRAARGELILPLDPDDLIVPGYLDAAVVALTRAPELDYVVGISSRFEDGSSPDRESDWIVPYDPDFEMLLYENGSGTAAAVFRREALQSFPYREDLPAYEDWELYLRLAAAGRCGESLPIITHRYRQRSDGLARRAHRAHDRLVAQLIAPHLEGAPAGLRGALEIYLASASRLRGIGDDVTPGPVADRVEAFYRRRLKTPMSDWLGEGRRDRIARWVRRLLRGR